MFDVTYSNYVFTFLCQFQLCINIFERHLLIWNIEVFVFKGFIGGIRLSSFDVVMVRFDLRDVHSDRITDLASPLSRVENFCDADCG